MNSRIHSSRCASPDPPTFGDPRQVYPALDAIFDRVFPLILIIGAVALGAGLYRSTVLTGWYPDFLFHIGVFLVVLGVFVIRRRFSVPMVFSFMLMISYVIAVKSLLNVGLASAGIMHLVFFCSFAGIFLGIKAGVITLIVGVLTLGLIGTGICTGLIKTRPDMAVYLKSPSKWILEVSFYLMYLAPMILSVNSLQKRMALSLRSLKSNNRQLEAEIAKRKHAEEELRQSEARLRQVIDLVPHYIYARDPQGRFILANKASAEAFGTTVEDLIGKTDTDFNRDKKEVEQFLRDDLEVLRGGLPKEISEEKVTDSKGNTRILHTIKIPYTVSSSGGEAVLAVSTDITRRKRAEEKSKESESRFREFADLLPQAVAEFDLMGNFTYGNLYGFEMFGYTQKEFDARTHNFSEMFVPQDLERLGSCIQKIFQGGKGSVNNEYTAKRKDGSVFPVMLYASPVIRGGKPAGWRAIACDITERKKIEQALRESEEKYRSVVEGSLAGFYVIQDNIFRFANQRACEITGYPYDEFVDRLSPFDMIHPDDRPKVEESLLSRLSGEKDYVEYDIRVIRRDGRIIIVKVFGSAMNYNGRRAVSGTFIDITREKTLESQLCQAQKMEAVGQLASGIAHDFNNILTALVGYASLLQMKIKERDPLRAYVNQILSASQKATSLTKRLLTFSRQQPRNLQSTGINKIIRGTEDLLKRLLTEDIILETRLVSDDLTIMVDAIQMDQILFNLVTNARDAMPKGGTLTIETEQALLDDTFLLTHGFGKPGRYALLSISDTGLGMDKPTRGKIFEPFFTTKPKGTGLGLATVYGIVKQHKGYITVDSEQTVGTAFRIYLPLIETKIDEKSPVLCNLKPGKEAIRFSEDVERG